MGEEEKSNNPKLKNGELCNKGASKRGTPSKHKWPEPQPVFANGMETRPKEWIRKREEETIRNNRE